jgi:hypothetical protein
MEHVIEYALCYAACCFFIMRACEGVCVCRRGMDRFGDGAYAAVEKRGRGRSRGSCAPARPQTASKRRRRGGGRGKREGEGEARVECGWDWEYVVCESRLVFAGRRHVLAPAGITRRISHLTRLIRHLTRLPFHDTNECMWWRHMWYVVHELRSTCGARASDDMWCTSLQACPPPASKPLRRMHVWPNEVAAALRSFVESERRTPLPPRAWQAPRQLLDLLAAAAALRGERARLWRHELASTSTSAAAHLGSCSPRLLRSCLLS